MAYTIAAQSGVEQAGSSLVEIRTEAAGYTTAAQFGVVQADRGVADRNPVGDGSLEDVDRSRSLVFREGPILRTWDRSAIGIWCHT